MQIKHRKKRRRHPFLTAFVGLVLIVGLSYGGATIWQHVQDGPSVRPQSSGPDSDIAVQGEASLSAPMAGTEASSSLPVPRADSPLLPNPDDTPPEDSSAPDSATPYTVNWQVPASAMVEKSYFDDAVFFGDSVSTGLTGYHIVDNAACYAAIGVSPQSALTGKYIGASVDSKKTLLDAALESGDRGKVYIMLGGNGLWMEKDAFIDDYQTFIDAVKERYPDAVIYIQSMTPVAAHVVNTYPNVSSEKVIEYNLAIADMAKSNKCHFVNVFEALAGPDGLLPAEVSPDGLHLSVEYYYLWFDYLRTHTVGG